MIRCELVGCLRSDAYDHARQAEPRPHLAEMLPALFKVSVTTGSLHCSDRGVVLALSACLSLLQSKMLTTGPWGLQSVSSLTMPTLEYVVREC